jgi:hypothetical protein
MVMVRRLLRWCADGLRVPHLVIGLVLFIGSLATAGGALAALVGANTHHLDVGRRASRQSAAIQGSIAADGDSVTVTTSSTDEDAALTFSGTAGETLGVGISDVEMSGSGFW